MPAIAQDRRSYDQDGRMHAPGCRISKANVCPYYGREIPGFEALGLDANRIYRMYRDPAALAEAATTFNNVPLHAAHVLVSVDDPSLETVVGTVSNARYEHPYLVADVTAWTREAIDDIESGDKKELSCAYRYVAHMISGTSPDGVRYDGKMIGPIQANHVALVAKGRAGPDVVVADEAIRMKLRFPRFLGALTAALAITAKPEELAAMDSALTEELAAADAYHELDDGERKAACDAAMSSLGKDSLTDEEEAEAYKRAAKDKRAARDAAEPAADIAPVVAADADTVQAAVDAALATARDGYVSKADADKLAADSAAAGRADALALVAAREAVAPRVGVVALDSAEAVYRFALDHAKISHADVPAVALPALYASVAGLPAAADSAISAPAAVDVRELFTGLSFTRKG